MKASSSPPRRARPNWAAEISQTTGAARVVMVRATARPSAQTLVANQPVQATTGRTVRATRVPASITSIQ